MVNVPKDNGDSTKNLISSTKMEDKSSIVSKCSRRGIIMKPVSLLHSVLRNTTTNNIGDMGAIIRGINIIMYGGEDWLDAEIEKEVRQLPSRLRASEAVCKLL
eukprot:4677141-Karenia_brevis.AAC.1